MTSSDDMRNIRDALRRMEGRAPYAGSMDKLADAAQVIAACFATLVPSVVRMLDAKAARDESSVV